jgi:hypothetical protein
MCSNTHRNSFQSSSSPVFSASSIALGAGIALISLTLAPGLARAQVDHFLAYPNAVGIGLPGPVVQIDDQFGTQTTDLGRPIRLLVPADKNDEGLNDPFSHVTCYEIVDGVAGPAVISTNQFGAQSLTLGVPESLCVPTEKLIFPGPVNLDHYKCYLASGADVDIGIFLQDQFQQSTALVGTPGLFCTPAAKNGEAILDPVTHLTCYDIQGPASAPGQIPILNQFLSAADVLQLSAPDKLCVPSTKQVVQPEPDHYQTYPISAATAPNGPIVQIDDQFGTQTTDLGRSIRFLVPVDKNDEGITDPISHLTCYDIVDGASAPPVISTNQFGAQPLTLGDPDSLCVPTEKLITPGAVDVDHYKCYEAVGAPLDVGVSLVDQFQGRTALALDPKLFCAPASKNGEPIDDPDTHLTCYSTSPIGGAPGPVPILNQFLAAPVQIELLEAQLLCAPSTKQLIPPLEHFLRYDATGPDGPPVTIDDQFGSQVTDLGDVNLFLVPADKNAEGLYDPFSHLGCHQILDGDPPLGIDVTVTNQFGTDMPIDVSLPRELCVPTEKLITPGPVTIDHFKCYEISGDRIDVSATFVDQFQGFTSLVAEPIRLCNPASKNGEPITDLDSHLVCYDLEPNGDNGPSGLPILNQFFPGGTAVDVGFATSVCVPSIKTVPEPGSTLGLVTGAFLLRALSWRREKRMQSRRAG